MTSSLTPEQTHSSLSRIVHALPGRIRVRVDGIHHDRGLAAGLEKLLRAQSGVTSVRANELCSSVVIEFKPELFDPGRFLDRLDLSHVRRITDHSGPTGSSFIANQLTQATFAFEEMVRPKAQFALAATGLLACLIEAPSIVTTAILSAAIAPIVNRALQSILHDRRLNADFLDGLTCVMLVRSGRFFPAALMSTLISLGELIRDVITNRCEKMIAHQLALSKRSAWLVKGNRRIRTPVNELRQGEMIVVYPGELVPCSGTVIKGKGTIIAAGPDTDFAARCVEHDNYVDPNTLLLDGKLYIKVEHVSLHQPRNLIREKQSRRWLQRTRLHRMALKASHHTVGPLLLVAAAFFAITKDIERVLSIITFDLITGIKIAIPITVLSAMYRAGDSGIVMRNASALEGLAEINAVIFARSGVLTTNFPIVTELFVVDGFTQDQVTSYAAAVEQQYNHFAAYAIYSFVEKHTVKIPERTNSSLISGLGVKGEVGGHQVIVGRTKLMDMEHVDLSPASDFLLKCEQRGDFRACVAIDGQLAGVIAYQDPLRAEMVTVISRLQQLGIKEIAMMTGGSEIASSALARKAGISTTYPRTLPSEQAAIVKQYRDRGFNVAVIGYDVDDALALEQANIAITLGSAADVARHRADIVLASDDISGLVEGIEMAREGMSLAHQNLGIVSVPNFVGFVVSLFKSTDPVIATLVNNGSVIIGATNGLRPLLTEEDGEQDEDIDDPVAMMASPDKANADQANADEGSTLLPRE